MNGDKQTAMELLDLINKDEKLCLLLKRIRKCITRHMVMFGKNPGAGPAAWGILVNDACRKYEEQPDKDKVDSATKKYLAGYMSREFAKAIKDEAVVRQYAAEQVQ